MSIHHHLYIISPLSKAAKIQVCLGTLDGLRKVAVKIVDFTTQRHQQRFVHEIAQQKGPPGLL